MKLLSLVTAIGLGLALSVGAQQMQQGQQIQPPDEQQTQTHKPKKEQAEQNTGTNERGKTNVQETQKSKTGTRSSTSQTNVNQSTKVNVQEFKARHSEVFSLGRHPREFFVQRFGVTHVRLITNTVFVFVDGCWVAVDAEGFVFAERVICAGDPDFVEVVE